jgi:hypothetical protein
MLKANLVTGQTLTFDLRDADQLAAWERSQADADFQSQLRALAIHSDGHMHTLPTPPRFARIAFYAELLPNGERVSCLADDVMCSLTVYSGGNTRMSRVDFHRMGKVRYVPDGAGCPPVRRSGGR